ncbi:hypothetical protein ACJIZ3_022859 [Penstemon smallii]|uniref:NAC domain-containing protein n=1 Tax=Penstemon smallii TaxID=265156 RepID=A0ABD3TPB2_9LAMI
MVQDVVSGAPPPTALAPGFRFHPTDEELVRFYLRRKVCGKPFKFQAVSELDVYKSEPWEVSEHSALKTRDLEWYFFSPVDRKYGNGSRLNRATGKGYWKATGKDRSVRHKGVTTGMKKTLVFHGGRAPEGKRTNWVMHEYRLCDSELENAGVAQKDAFVLCRIFQKSGLGPPNGNRYAPFVEEEWDDDIPVVVPSVEVEDDVATGDEIQAEYTDTDFNRDTEIFRMAPPQVETPDEAEKLPSFMLKRERSSEDPELLSLAQSKRSKPNNNPSSSHVPNGSEDSTTTSLAPHTFKTPPTSFSLEFPFLGPPEPKENIPVNSVSPVNPFTFDSSNLEKSVPPGYLKFISNLESEIMSGSVERETLKIELMRSKAVINMLQSQVDVLAKENAELRRNGLKGLHL